MFVKEAVYALKVTNERTWVIWNADIGVARRVLQLKPIPGQAGSYQQLAVYQFGVHCFFMSSVDYVLQLILI